MAGKKGHGKRYKSYEPGLTEKERKRSNKAYKKRMWDKEHKFLKRKIRRKQFGGTNLW